MTSSERIHFDANRIDATARTVDQFREEFTAHSSRVRGERERSVESFIGVAGDEFRGLCNRWLTDADDFADTLSELAHWLDAVNADYAAARSASRTMFPG